MYIRTKDGVYEVEGRKFYDALKRKHYITTKGLAIKEDDIINQSENLEELCDCFVKVWCNVEVNPEVLIYNEQYEEEKENILLVYPKGNIIIYGAIWTSKGLIYVAKMNENGELCLL